MAQNEDAATHFFCMGLQYYAAGRLSAIASFIPVSGNLLHHAVEMLLKGHLSRRLTLAQLKGLSHRLGDVWEKFKRDVKDSGLDDLDQVVAALDRFEEIRYPDRIVSQGMFGSISIFAPPPKAESMQGAPSLPAYELVLEEVDRLVRAIFEKSLVNPRFFSGMVGTEGAAVLKKDNKWPLDI